MADFIKMTMILKSGGDFGGVSQESWFFPDQGAEKNSKNAVNLALKRSGFLGGLAVVHSVRLTRFSDAGGTLTKKGLAGFEDNGGNHWESQYKNKNAAPGRNAVMTAGCSARNIYTDGSHSYDAVAFPPAEASQDASIFSSDGFPSLAATDFANKVPPYVKALITQGALRLRRTLGTKVFIKKVLVGADGKLTGIVVPTAQLTAADIKVGDRVHIADRRSPKRPRNMGGVRDGLRGDRSVRNITPGEETGTSVVDVSCGPETIIDPCATGGSLAKIGRDLKVLADRIINAKGKPKRGTKKSKVRAPGS